jgi:hypothetical protein
VARRADAAPRRVEVDHVEVRRALAPEAARDRERIVAVVGRRVEAALEEAHDAPALQVDRGHQLEGGGGLGGRRRCHRVSMIAC